MARQRWDRLLTDLKGWQLIQHRPIFASEGRSRRHGGREESAAPKGGRLSSSDYGNPSKYTCPGWTLVHEPAQLRSRRWCQEMTCTRTVATHAQLEALSPGTEDLYCRSMQEGCGLSNWVRSLPCLASLFLRLLMPSDNDIRLRLSSSYSKMIATCKEF